MQPADAMNDLAVPGFGLEGGGKAGKSRLRIENGQVRLSNESSGDLTLSEGRFANA